MAGAEHGSECSPQSDTGTHPASCSLVFQVDYRGLSHKGLRGRGVNLTFHLYMIIFILIFNILQKKRKIWTTRFCH
jgi:hypothetical protein